MDTRTCLYTLPFTLFSPMENAVPLMTILVGTSKNPIPSTDTAPVNATITR